MSTDTYIDVHAPGMYDLYRDDWQAWITLRGKEKAAGNGEPYVPIRIGYVFNFIMDANFDRWQQFEARWSGTVVSRESIEALVSDYRVLYDQAAEPAEDADNAFCREDIVPPEVVAAELSPFVGYTIYVRVD